MSPSDFKKLPPLIRRADVVEAGIPADAIDALRVEVTSAEQKVPFGKLGVVRGLARNRRRKGKGNALYRTMDVACLLGPLYQ